jgi:hypothetical protein
MTRLVAILILFAAAFGTAAEGAAVVLTTAPVLGDRVTCLMTNASNRAVTVNVDLVGPSATIALAENAVIDGGGFALWGSGDDEAAYCRFTLIQGTTQSVRAAACGIITSLGDKCASTAEAR